MTASDDLCSDLHAVMSGLGADGALAMFTALNRRRQPSQPWKRLCVGASALPVAKSKVHVPRGILGVCVQQRSDTWQRHKPLLVEQAHHDHGHLELLLLTAPRKTERYLLRTLNDLRRIR